MKIGADRLRRVSTKWTAGFGVILFALVLTGCQSVQNQPLSAAAAAAVFEARTLDDAGLKSFIETHLSQPLPSWPLASWDLTNLVLAAFHYHPDLETARAKWAVARAGRAVAGERPNPVLSVVPAYNTTTAIPSPWLVTPSLDVPIETAGKRGYRLAQAAHLSEAARWQIVSAAWQVRGRVRRSLADLCSAQDLEALLKAHQSIQDESVRLLDQQYQAGAISAFELTQARLAAGNTRLSLREAERQRAEALVQTADAIGVPAGALAGVRLSCAGFGLLPEAVDTVAARHQALLNRSDILSALAEYAAAQSALQLEIAKQYPDVHFNPGYEFDQGDHKWALGLSLTLPVLNRNRGPIAEAVAKRAEAASRFHALQARIIGEIDRAVAVYRVALQKMKDTDELQVNLQKQEKAAQAMLEAGEISRGELAALRLQISTSALARLDALTKSQQALGQLEAALQGPLGLPDSAWQASSRIPERPPADPHP